MRQDINSLIRLILDALKLSGSQGNDQLPVFTHVLMDCDVNRYAGSIDCQMLEDNHIELVQRPLVHPHQTFYDAECLYSELADLTTTR